MARYAHRRNDQPLIIHSRHWWYRRDITCGGAVSRPLTKAEVERLLKRGGFLCTNCFPNQ